MAEIKQIPFGKPLIGKEERAVKEVLSGPILVHGEQSKEFESSFATFTSAPNAVSVSSCTAGMHLIYHALGFGPGDEVIVPAQTHVATAHAVALQVQNQYLLTRIANGEYRYFSNRILNFSENSAIAVVHYLGVPVDMRGSTKSQKT